MAPEPNERLRQARMSVPSPTASGRHLSRQELADLVNAKLAAAGVRHGVLDSTYVGKLERGEHRWPQDAYRAAFRAVLGAESDADLGFFIIRRQVNGSTHRLHRSSLVQAFDGALPGTVDDAAGLDESSSVVVLPGGRALRPVTLLFHPAVADPGKDPVGRLRRFVYEFAETKAGARIAEARHHSLASAATVDSAYVLDELTVGLVWMVCAMDQELLEDDGDLHDAWRNASRYTAITYSSVSNDIATGLSTVSQMWLGSQFCATYIQRSLPLIATEPPIYWTREQRGEEAATWLLFRHKLEYLQATGGAGISRVFCVPSDALASSPPSERTLLLLTVALMESFDIRCDVVADPAYAAMDGFALVGNRAIRANWIRTQGLWNVDLLDHRPAVREYADASRFARAMSINSAEDSLRRLRHLAEYLGIDWTWFQLRCTQLAQAKVSGLVRPRSRLLSMTGIQAACEYVGQSTTEYAR